MQKRGTLQAIYQRWFFLRTLLRRPIRARWLAILVGGLGLLSASLGYYRDEWPNSWQPPYLSEILAALPWWSWLLLAMAAGLAWLFETSYREVTSLGGAEPWREVPVPVQKGYLDFVVDVENATKQFPRELARITNETRKVNQKLLKRTEDWKRQQGSARKQQQTASKLAEDLRGFADRVNQRVLRVEEEGSLMTRGMLGILEHHLSPLSEAQVDELASLKEAVTTLLRSTHESQSGIQAFRQAALNVRQKNMSKDLNVAIEQHLVRSLDRLVGTLKGFAETTARSASTIEKRRRELAKATRNEKRQRRRAVARANRR